MRKLDQKIKFILDNLENYKDRLSLALKIADISIFEVDLKNKAAQFSHL